jgi:hypothetical protein
LNSVEARTYRLAFELIRCSCVGSSEKDREEDGFEKLGKVWDLVTRYQLQSLIRQFVEREM